MKTLLVLSICFLATRLLIAQPKIRNSIGMEFVLIEPGTMTVGEFTPPYPVPQDTIKAARHDYIMWMGDGRSYNQDEFKKAKQQALLDSQPGFEVTIKQSYYISSTEVTQAQWKRVMGNNPSQFKNVENADSLPVESVSWGDAKKFIAKLNRMEKHGAYRLPTEFEWEYAARAGAKKDILWKDIEASANLNKRNPIPVANKKPNAWGLYDMLGNVWEWVEDRYNEKLFADAGSPRKGEQHVLKGASFVGDVKNATYMTHAGGPGNGWDVGFRIVKDVVQK